LQKAICGGIYARVYCILVRVQCRRKESSRSLSHLLMSLLLFIELLISEHDIPCTGVMCSAKLLAANTDLV